MMTDKQDMAVIQAIADLTEIIRGIQVSISDLTESLWTLKERVEKLDEKP